MGEPSLVGALVRVAIVLLLLGATLRVVGRVTGRGRGAAGKGFVRRTIGGERRLQLLEARQAHEAAALAAKTAAPSPLAGVTTAIYNTLIRASPTFSRKREKGAG